MDRLALDTTFLIDLQNEKRGRGEPRGATAFLRAHPEAELLLPSVALGEYLEGFEDPRSRGARALVSVLRVLEVNEAVSESYATITRSLRRAGRLIGTNDLWIASTAVAVGLPLVTRNVQHFARVPDLEVVAYH